MEASLTTSVIIGSVGGIAMIAVFGIWSSNLADNGKFIGKLHAITAAKGKYPFLQKEDLQPQFGYLKFEGIDANSIPRFSWYAAEPSSGKVLGILHSNITITNTPIFDKDYYVWTFSYYIPTSPRIVLIDGEKGDVIGGWVPCPQCVCNHYGMNYK